MQDQTEPRSPSAVNPPSPRHWGIPAFLWSVWVIYVGYVLLSELPPGDSVWHTQPETWQTAIALSLNFWFVLPIALPHVAPVLPPALEGLFNLVVTWGLLFWGFAVDGRQQRVPIAPFLLGTAFLTNVFYLPWLALRRPHPDPPPLPLTRLERVGESRVWALLLLGVAGLSLGWAAIARSEFGDLPTRWANLVDLVQRDRLAYSFFVDCLVFWAFQSWLVPDDMARRHWHNPAILWMTRTLPFVGLVIYFLLRPHFTSDRPET